MNRAAFDWDDLRFFLAVAREGSTIAAAKALGVSQPTVQRRHALGGQPVGEQQRATAARAVRRDCPEDLKAPCSSSLDGATCRLPPSSPGCWVPRWPRAWRAAFPGSARR